MTEQDSRGNSRRKGGGVSKTGLQSWLLTASSTKAALHLPFDLFLGIRATHKNLLEKNVVHMQK